MLEYHTTHPYTYRGDVMKNKYCVNLISFILMLFIISSCNTKEHVVFTGEKPFQILQAECAPDGQHWYAVCEAPYTVGNKKRFVFLDGVAGPEFDMILMSPAFTAQGKIAYAASTSGQWFINIDGIMDTPYTEVSAPIFTHDGSRYAYMARVNRKSSVIDNGIAGDEYDYVSWPVFSANNTLAFVKKNFPNFQVVIGEKESEPFDDADLPTFDTTGENYAYPVSQQNQWAIVANGILKEWWDAVGTPVHTINGVAYPARKYTKWFWYMQEMRGPGYDYVFGGSVSPDGTRIAYCAQEDFKRFAVIDGIRGDNFDNVSPVVFSESGVYAYRAENNNKECIVTPSGYGPLFDSISMPLFGGEKVSLVYAAKESGRWNVYRDHRPVFKKSYNYIGNIIYSSEKKRFFAIAQSENTLIKISWK